MALPQNGLNGWLPTPAGEDWDLPWPVAALPEAYVSAYVEGSTDPAYTGATEAKQRSAMSCGPGTDTGFLSRSGPTVGGSRFEAAIVQNTIYRAALIDAVEAAPGFQRLDGVPGSVLIQNDPSDPTDFVDLVNLVGPRGVEENWVKSVEWGEDVENPVPDFKLVLFRTQDKEHSLSPLMDGSLYNLAEYLDLVTSGGSTAGFDPSQAEPRPLVMPGKMLRVQTAVMAEEFGVSDVLHLLMDGVVDSVDMAGDEGGVVVEGRGIGAEILDRQVEETRQYGGTAPGTEMGGVFQTILYDWAPEMFTIFNPYAILFGPNGTWEEPWPAEDHTNALLPFFDFDKDQSLLQALKDIAAQAGRELRYVKGPGNEPWRLTMYQIPRTRIDDIKNGLAEPDFTLGPDEWKDLTVLRMSRETVRNKIKVFFTYANGTEDFTVVADAASQEKYGRHYMSVDMTGTFIDTLQEAQDFALAALSDLAEPYVVLGLDRPFKWDTFLHQVWALEPDGDRFSETQYLAVHGYRHSVALKTYETHVEFFGRPTGSIEDWLRKAGSGPEVVGGGSAPGAALAYPIEEIERRGCPQGPVYRFTWSVDGALDAAGYHAVVQISENGVVTVDLGVQALSGSHDWDYPGREAVDVIDADSFSVSLQGFVQIVRESDGVVVSSAHSSLRTFQHKNCS